MITNIEFWAEEPLDNLISTFNLKFDKTIYLHEETAVGKTSTEKYLTRNGLVKSVEFFQVEKDNIEQIISKIESIVDNERKNGNNVFFEIKGGREVELVALGELAGKTDIPFYYYDIEKQTIVELNKTASDLISRDVEKRNHRMNIDSFIRVRKAVIVERMHKDAKEIDLEKQSDDIDKLLRVFNEFNDVWNQFASFFSKYLKNEDSLDVDVYTSDVIKNLKKTSGVFSTQLKLRAILDELEKNALIENLDYQNTKYVFKIKNSFVKQCLSDPGMLLEIETYIDESKDADDCQIGVHLDWDGVIHNETNDVLNEIDVLRIENNIPTFISCKNGRLKDALTPLYELEVVARRFGGKYAKKKLVVTQELTVTQKERADALGIEIVER